MNPDIRSFVTSRIVDCIIGLSSGRDSAELTQQVQSYIVRTPPQPSQPLQPSSVSVDPPSLDVFEDAVSDMPSTSQSANVSFAARPSSTVNSAIQSAVPSASASNAPASSSTTSPDWQSVVPSEWVCK